MPLRITLIDASRDTPRTFKRPRTEPHLLRERLIARFQRRFPLTRSLVRIGRASFEFVSVTDPDAVLDHACQLESQRLPTDAPVRVPYWATVWESAAVLGEHLVASDRLDPSSSVLEIGSGMGLLGSALASLGFRITLTDHESDALALARINTLLHFPRATVRHLDWTGSTLPARYPTIVAADVLYDTTQWPAIERCLQRHLAPGGRVLIAEPGRPSADAFEHFAARAGFAVAIDSIERDSAPRLIRIYSLTSTPEGRT